MLLVGCFRLFVLLLIILLLMLRFGGVVMFLLCWFKFVSVCVGF